MVKTKKKSIMGRDARHRREVTSLELKRLRQVKFRRIEVNCNSGAQTGRTKVKRKLKLFYPLPTLSLALSLWIPKP